MKLIIDESIKEFLVEEIQNNWGKETREGIHLTDLLTPRKKYWQTIKPQKADIKDILTWLPGIEFESRFKRAINVESPPPRQWKGIWYSCDLFFNFPCEIKMRRRNLGKAESLAMEYDWYLRQLKGYCAIENKQQGWLIVYTPVQREEGTNRTHSDFHSVRVEFTEQELIDERRGLETMRDLLTIALETRTPEALPPCPDWMCRKERKKLIKPALCKTCGKKEYKNIKRHLEGKRGKGHEIIEAQYEIEYDDCKWYQECKNGKN
jgi:predicted Zn-ribbon and HTH transcriptional regulator